MQLDVDKACLISMETANEAKETKLIADDHYHRVMEFIMKVSLITLLNLVISIESCD